MPEPLVQVFGKSLDVTSVRTVDQINLRLCLGKPHCPLQGHFYDKAIVHADCRTLGRLSLLVAEAGSEMTSFRVARDPLGAGKR